MRIIVCGTRTFNNYEVFKNVMRQVMQIVKDEIPNVQRSDVEIISGGAKGADTFAETWATKNGFKFTKFDAEWDKLGKSAGYSRNIVMADYATEDKNNMCIGFWDGESKGTRNMLHLALMYKMTRIIYDYISAEIHVDNIQEWNKISP